LKTYHISEAVVTGSKFKTSGAARRKRNDTTFGTNNPLGLAWEEGYKLA